MHKSSRIIANYSDAVERELCDLITKIVDTVTDNDTKLKVEHVRLSLLQEDTIEKLAGMAELKIKMKETKRLRKQILAILRSSTNRIIISTLARQSN